MAQKAKEIAEEWDRKVKCPHCPGVYANEVMKFVGFRGSIDKDGICHLEKNGQMHEGEAYPPPINMNREYLGVLMYEVEVMTLCWLLGNIYKEKTAIMVLLPRGEGKTYINVWTDQMSMKYFHKNIMMLSETNSRYKVGNWIYLWALKNKYLKNPDAYARKNTYLHCELLNGTRMDIYQFMKEDLVGEHNFMMVLDDCVKRNWRSKPTENERAIEHWQSNVNYITRSGLFIYGTRKFEGDLLEHVAKTLEEMIVIKSSPFIECPHGNRNTDGTFDPCDICKDACLLAPEIHTYEHLMRKMKEDYEAWYAEMMQNPRLLEGGMVDRNDLEFTIRPHFTEVQMVGVGVDATEGEMDSNDMCGIVSCAMGGVESAEFTFLDADVRKMPFRNYTDPRTKEFHRGQMETISAFVSFLETHYPRIPIIVAIERQGGGIFIIREAKNNYKEFTWHAYIVGEIDKTTRKMQAVNALGITHSKEKVARVFAELRYPIKEKQAKFTKFLEGTEFVKQICGFPKGRFDDGPDAAGMIKDELQKRFRRRAELQYRKTAEEKAREAQVARQWEAMKAPWVTQQRLAAQQQKQTARVLEKMGFRKE